eukprot:13160934-Alexandrium_andersonii.AAC.1
MGPSGSKLLQAARSCFKQLEALDALFTLSCSPLGAARALRLAFGPCRPPANQPGQGVAVT